MTPEGDKLLLRLERLMLKRYPDSGGRPTIGCGHLLTKDELSSGKIRCEGRVFDIRQGLTVEQAMTLMHADIVPATRAVVRAVQVPLNEHQLDALICFTFNVGGPAFTHSTLVKKLNTGDYLSVPDQMRRWIYDGGVKVDGLVHRREAEIQLWLRPA